MFTGIVQRWLFPVLISRWARFYLHLTLLLGLERIVLSITPVNKLPMFCYTTSNALISLFNELRQR